MLYNLLQATGDWLDRIGLYWLFQVLNQLEFRAFTETVERELAGVAPWQVEVFRMRHFENLSIPEICARTDRTSDAVRSSLYRVKRLFLDAAEPVRAS